MFTVTLRGYLERTEGQPDDDYRTANERSEALVTAEIEAMLPEFVKRLAAHGLNFVHVSAGYIAPKLIADKTIIDELVKVRR